MDTTHEIWKRSILKNLPQPDPIERYKKKVVKPSSQDAAGTYPGFCSMKRLEVIQLPVDGMLVHDRSLPHNLLGLPVPIYTPGWILI